MAIQEENTPTRHGYIKWATTWVRSKPINDSYGFAAITDTHLIIVEPEDGKPPAVARQAATHKMVHRAGSDQSWTDYSMLDELIRTTKKSLTIERSSIVAIQALPKGNLLRIRTTNDIHLVGNFSHKEHVTQAATQLVAQLVPNAEPRIVARPKLTTDLLKHLAVVPATVGFFFLVAIAARFLIGGSDGAVTTRAKHRLLEETLGAIPMVVLIAAALLTVAALVVRIIFRVQDEVRWTV